MPGIKLIQKIIVNKHDELNEMVLNIIRKTKKPPDENPYASLIETMGNSPVHPSTKEDTNDSYIAECEREYFRNKNK